MQVALSLRYVVEGQPGDGLGSFFDGGREVTIADDGQIDGHGCPFGYGLSQLMQENDSLGSSIARLSTCFPLILSRRPQPATN